MDTKDIIYHTEQVDDDQARSADDKAGHHLGYEETHKEARSPWKVLFENKKALLLILAVQSNAMIVGVEFSMPGNLLGIPAFLKEVSTLCCSPTKYISTC